VATEPDERGLLIRLRDLAPRLDELLRQTRQLCDDVTAAARRAKNSISPKLNPSAIRGDDINSPSHKKRRFRR
jgi:hypothetical protein